MWIPMLYIGTSTYFKFHFVAKNSIDKQGHIGTISGPGLDISIQNKNKQESITMN
jgi:hypothetical protein